MNKAVGGLMNADVKTDASEVVFLVGAGMLTGIENINVSIF